MPDFSLTSFAAFATGMIVEINHAKHAGLEKAAKIIEKEAKDSLGTYQDGWPQLAESTQENRSRAGYSANEPGLMSGAMKESISHSVGHDEARVGSNDQNLVYFELGTVKQPPRTVLVGAALRKIEDVRHVLGKEVATTLVK